MEHFFQPVTDAQQAARLGGTVEQVTPGSNKEYYIARVGDPLIQFYRIQNNRRMEESGRNRQ